MFIGQIYTLGLAVEAQHVASMRTKSSSYHEFYAPIRLKEKGFLLLVCYFNSKWKKTLKYFPALLDAFMCIFLCLPFTSSCKNCYLRHSSQSGLQIQTVPVYSHSLTYRRIFQIREKNFSILPPIPGCASFPILFSFDTYTVLTTSECKAILRFSVCGLLTGKIKFFFSLSVRKHTDFCRRPHTIFYIRSSVQSSYSDYQSR